MKDKTTYGILAILLGGLGVHRFYVGQVGKGILYLLFCWTFIPALIGFIEGIVWLTRSNEEFQMRIVNHGKMSAEQVAALAAARAAKEAEAAELAAQRESAARAAKELRRAELVEKYGEQMTEIILANKIIEGMPTSAVIEAWGKPGDIKEDRNKGIVKQKLYYAPYLNAQKKTSYKQEVRVENGIVTGWKDL